MPPLGPVGLLLFAEDAVTIDFDASTSTGRDPLRSLRWAVQFREYIEGELPRVVDEARESGATWTQIGEALGVSHQAAIKRYKRTA